MPRGRGTCRAGDAAVTGWLLGGGIMTVAWLWDVWRRPYAACLACKGRRGKNAGSTGKVWGRCGLCGGTGERLRVGSRLVNRRLRK